MRFAAIPLVALFSLSAVAQEPTAATARLLDGKGQEIGTAQLLQSHDGVLIQIEVAGLPADQWVAFHVHQEGVCDPETNHESAGGHFNPVDREHGYAAEGGFHAGDMPNLYVPADGILRAHVFNQAVTLVQADNGIRGRALMIHAGPDDYKSQPSGEAGARLACGVIE